MLGLAFVLTAAAPIDPPPIVQSEAEALAQDATVYARRYDVPVAEAMRRLVVQQASVGAIDRLRASFHDRLAGLVIEHRPLFRIVVLLTGDVPEPDTILGDGLALPVTFRTGARATHDRIVAAIEGHQAELAAAFATPPGLGVDERTGALAILVRPQDATGEAATATAARLEDIAGVPVELEPWSGDSSNLAVQGGSRVVGSDPARTRRFVCTSGFVVTDGMRTGVITAAHCPDELRAIGPDRQELPLTMVDAWGARYQDVQIHVATDPATPPFPPLFFADTARSLARPVTRWRNRASTRAGDFVCHRGERTGYSCAEVAFVDFAPPGELCFGLCPPTWVAVRGPDCRSGDSGGPVFAGTIAFGIVKGASYTADGACHLYYYMSTDYLPPRWTLLYQSAPAAGTSP